MGVAGTAGPWLPRGDDDLPGDDDNNGADVNEKFRFQLIDSKTFVVDKHNSKPYYNTAYIHHKDFTCSSLYMYRACV